ncbi:hypothetical protein [Lysinibacillus cavernae]|uniref:hypothetical protein n=1 Tax=Lysinibacillus cavernae TaxID=2666135 RepID=UPI0012D976C7|nr:hypothetical protein [Lysinibacillus cavernae]
MKTILHIFFLLICFVIVVSLLVKEKQPLPVATSSNNSSPYAEELGEKLQATNFTQKVLTAIREAGYSPDSTIGYLIDSPDHQVITIQLHDGEEVDISTESEIQSIIDELAKKNNIHLFIVNVQLLGAE